jgi:putative nucleotidyltransferase with HDIG domain
MARAAGGRGKAEEAANRAFRCARDRPIRPADRWAVAPPDAAEGTAVASKLSIFAQRMDRALFVAYFLGGVVPLLAVAWVFAWPELDAAIAADGGAARARFLGQLGLLLSCGALCLGSFFVLQRFVHQALARVDADQARLARLVEVSEAVADAPHAGEVARRVADAARAVSEAGAAYVFLSGAKDTPLELVDHAGERAEEIYGKAQRAIDAMVKLTVEGGRPTLVGDGSARSEHAGLTAGAAVPLRAKDGARGALVTVHVERGRAFDPRHAGALSTLAGLAAVAVHNADLRDAQRNFFSHVTDLLVQALDAHLQFHVGHSHRVAALANRVGRALKLGDVELHRLHFGALLHDIGMLKLDRTQQMNLRTCDKHPQLGARMLARIRLWKDVGPIVQHHHEWWDGHGYPDGIAGDAIPIEARIVALCDAFDTMTSDESYKPAVSVEEALAEIDACAGTQFDPSLARTLRRVIQDEDSAAA